MPIVAEGEEAYASGLSEADIVNSGVTNDSVNFRIGPGTNHAVHGVLDAGDQIAIAMS